MSIKKRAIRIDRRPNYWYTFDHERLKFFFVLDTQDTWFRKSVESAFEFINQLGFLQVMIVADPVRANNENTTIDLPENAVEFQLKFGNLLRITEDSADQSAICRTILNRSFKKKPNYDLGKITCNIDKHDVWPGVIFHEFLHLFGFLHSHVIPTRILHHQSPSNLTRLLFDNFDDLVTENSNIYSLFSAMFYTQKALQKKGISLNQETILNLLNEYNFSSELKKDVMDALDYVGRCFVVSHDDLVALLEAVYTNDPVSFKENFSQGLIVEPPPFLLIPGHYISQSDRQKLIRVLNALCEAEFCQYPLLLKDDTVFYYFQNETVEIDLNQEFLAVNFSAPIACSLEDDLPLGLVLNEENCHIFGTVDTADLNSSEVKTASITFFYQGEPYVRSLDFVLKNNKSSQPTQEKLFQLQDNVTVLDACQNQTERFFVYSVDPNITLSFNENTTNQAVDLVDACQAVTIPYGEMLNCNLEDTKISDAYVNEKCQLIVKNNTGPGEYNITVSLAKVFNNSITLPIMLTNYSGLSTINDSDSNAAIEESSAYCTLRLRIPASSKYSRSNFTDIEINDAELFNTHANNNSAYAVHALAHGVQNEMVYQLPKNDPTISLPTQWFLFAGVPLMQGAAEAVLARFTQSFTAPYWRGVFYLIPRTTLLGLGYLNVSSLCIASFLEIGLPYLINSLLPNYKKAASVLSFLMIASLEYGPSNLCVLTTALSVLHQGFAQYGLAPAIKYLGYTACETLIRQFDHFFPNKDPETVQADQLIEKREKSNTWCNFFINFFQKNETPAPEQREMSQSCSLLVLNKT